MNQRPLELLLYHLRAIAKEPKDKWARNFARSILRQSKKPIWQPSAKQLTTMERLVDEEIGLGNEDEFQLIEEP
jgi:hypothetical protein